MRAFKTLFITILTATISIASLPENTQPTAENYQQWIKYIRSTEKENNWQTIAWRNRLMPAVKEAKKLNRPVLLWAMNGNPCGET